MRHGSFASQEDLMKSIEAFSKSLIGVSFGKTPKVLLHAWDNFIEVKHAQPEEVQELLSKLVQDMKIISDELSEYNHTRLGIALSSTVMMMMTRTIPLQSHPFNDVEYVEASPPNSEPVSSKVMEIVIPEVGRIEDDILLIKDDTLREKLLNVNRLVAKIEALKDNPVPSSVVVTKSTSTFPNLFLEETNTLIILCPN
ncbi:hypothetical protein Tco_0384953 [Tanacetum coccineum]